MNKHLIYHSFKQYNSNWVKTKHPWCNVQLQQLQYDLSQDYPAKLCWLIFFAKNPNPSTQKTYGIIITLFSHSMSAHIGILTTAVLILEL